MQEKPVFTCFSYYCTQTFLQAASSFSDAQSLAPEQGEQKMPNVFAPQSNR